MYVAVFYLIFRVYYFFDTSYLLFVFFSLMNYRIKENSLIARIAAWKMSAKKLAIVIGRTIHLYNTSEAEFLRDQRWLKHELCHIEQFRRFGFVRFITLYLVESIRKGYYNNKYEVEARQAERR